MINQQLNEYLENILDIEQGIQLRNNLIDELKSVKIESPKESHNQTYFEKIDKPKKPKEPQAPTKAEKPSIWFTLFLLGIVAPLLGSLLPVIFIIFTERESYLIDNDIASISLGTRFICILFVELIFIFFIFINWYQYKKNQNSSYDFYEKQKNFYNKEMQNYEKALKKYNDEIKHHEDMQVKRNEIVKTQKNFIQEEINQLEEENLKSRAILKKYYDLGKIHKDYIGDITALCSFHDYTDKGICNELEGTDGAYSRYESEKLIKEIISYENAQTMLLQNIGQELNSIRLNQGTLYKVLQENNDTTKRILRANQDTLNEIKNIGQQSEIHANELNKKLDEVVQSSAVTAYNTGRSQKELDYLRQLDDIENGRWWNF